MSNLYTLVEAVRRVESVPVEAQTILKDVILETLYRKNPLPAFVSAGKELHYLSKQSLPFESMPQM